MKRMMILVMSACIMCSCGRGDLTREEAGKILKNQNHAILGYVIMDPYFAELPDPNHKVLSDHGYGAMTRSGPNNFWKYVPNDKIRPYIVRMQKGHNFYDGQVMVLLLAKCECGEITGISKVTDTTSIVEFKTHLNIDQNQYPLANLLMNMKEYKSEFSSCENLRKVKFLKYDDGWRNEDIDWK